MKTLLIGADGGIGTRLEEYLTQKDIEVWCTTRRQSCIGNRRFFLDLSISGGIDRIPTDFSAVVVLAAVTSQSECAQFPENSKLINVAATLRIAKRFLESGAQVIIPSTSLVFSGEHPFPGIQDRLEPVGEYAAQKVMIESALASLSPSNTAIVRLSKVLHRSNPLFSSWLSELSQGKTITPFEDLNFSPISDEFAAAVFYKYYLREKAVFSTFLQKRIFRTAMPPRILQKIWVRRIKGHRW